MKWKSNDIINEDIQYTQNTDINILQKNKVLIRRVKLCVAYEVWHQQLMEIWDMLMFYWTTKSSYVH